MKRNSNNIKNFPFINNYRSSMMNYNKFNILFAAFVLLLVASSSSWAQLDESRIQKELPLLLNSSNASNAGTQFNMAFHPCWEETGGNNAIRIYVSSAVATRVTMEIPGRGMVEQKVTTPNDVIAFHLLPATAQPYSKTDRVRPRPTAIYRGQAVIITSDDPVICYGVTRYQYTSDGYLAIPVTGLGTEYVVSSFGDPVNSDETNRFQWLTSYTSIVGIYDNTRVDFRLGGHERTWVPRNGYEENEALKPGQSMREYLDAGDIWLIPAMGNSADLTGSYVRANKPVGVIGGSFCAYIPLHISACDFIIEQDLPIHTWGNHYHVTPIARRVKNSYVSIFAKENNTTVYRDGIPWLSVSQGKGGIIDQGYIQRRISNTNDPLKGYTLSSEPDKPIAVTQYNTGMSDDGVPTDPFQMVLTPMEQFQTEIVFNTPGINDEYSFVHNHLNVVYLGAPEGGIPDDMEFGEVKNSVITWKRLNTMDGFPGYPLWTTPREDGRQYFAKQINLPGDGVYRFRADEPFAAYAYGGSNWDSYGFPTSVALADFRLFSILWTVLVMYHHKI